MRGVVADTHATLWYLNGSSNLSDVARAAMTEAVEAGGAIVVAAITLVEVAYLIEKARIEPNSFEQIATALAEPESGFALASLDLAVEDALRRVPRESIPDMPDRIIAATAVLLGLPLVSRDRKIVASSIHTIW